jgi:hypothetical protein
VKSRPLQGYAVGISISESEDSSGNGFPPWQINRVTVQTASALLGQGAGLVFGHDWREDGVMDAIYRFAIQLAPQLPASSAEDGSAIETADQKPLIVNVLPWPDQPRLSEEEIKRLGAVLKIETGRLPKELEDRLATLNVRDENTQKYLRARGLTELRHRLNETANARICFGGKKRGYQGRYPGIVEEALFAVQSRKPLYLAGLLGGATSQVIEALERKEMPDDFCNAAPMQELFRKEAELEPGAIDREINPRDVWTELSEFGIAGLSAVNGLSPDDNKKLFHTPILDQAIGLILEGLARVHKGT